MARSWITFVAPVGVFFGFFIFALIYFRFREFSAQLVGLWGGVLILYFITVDALLNQRLREEESKKILQQTLLAGGVLCIWLTYGLVWENTFKNILNGWKIAAQIAQPILGLLYAKWRVPILKATDAVGVAAWYSALRGGILLITVLFISFIPVNIAHLLDLVIGLLYILCFFIIWYTEMLMGGLTRGDITNEYLVITSLGVLRTFPPIAGLYVVWFVAMRIMDVNHRSTPKERESVAQAKKIAQLEEGGGGEEDIMDTVEQLLSEVQPEQKKIPTAPPTPPPPVKPPSPPKRKSRYKKKTPRQVYTEKLRPPPPPSDESPKAKTEFQLARGEYRGGRRKI